MLMVDSFQKSYSNSCVPFDEPVEYRQTKVPCKVGEKGCWRFNQNDPCSNTAIKKGTRGTSDVSMSKS